MRRTSFILAASFIMTSAALAENWPGFRGPTGDGKSNEKNLPTTWSDTKNVKWKIDLPEEGNSSPVIWGHRIFLGQPHDKKGHKRALWCIDRADGKVLWKREVPYEDKEPTHGTNPFCSATAVTDGERVIYCHGSAGLYCYDMNGKELWKYDLGKLYHIWGTASSPILHQNLCILFAGPGERQFLVAFDKNTGRKVWQHDEPGGSDGIKNKDWIGSWSTPVIARVNNREELILSCALKLKGFDPADGKELWSCDGLGKLVYTSPTVSADGIVVAFSGYGGPALACKAGGSGDVTNSHRLWHLNKGNPQSIGSAVIVGEHAYLVRATGVANCFELKTGKDLWKENLGGQTWGTLLHADGKFYIHMMDGSTKVLDASPKFKELAHHSLGPKEQTRATPAFSEGEIFLRTFRHLWCISEKK